MIGGNTLVLRNKLRWNLRKLRNYSLSRGHSSTRADRSNSAACALDHRITLYNRRRVSEVYHSHSGNTACLFETRGIGKTETPRALHSGRKSIEIGIESNTPAFFRRKQLQSLFDQQKSIGMLQWVKYDEHRLIRSFNKLFSKHTSPSGVSGIALPSHGFAEFDRRRVYFYLLRKKLRRLIPIRAKESALTEYRCRSRLHK